MSTITHVLFLSRLDAREWCRYFPAQDGCWGQFKFHFDPYFANYDWLVVYDDVPACGWLFHQLAVLPLRCPSRQTILITTEPESIKTYGRQFAAQFGHVITSQPAWALPHPRRTYRHAANHWFYGSARVAWMDRVRLLEGPPPDSKSDSISMMASPKRSFLTNHGERYAFMHQIKTLMPELKLFGHGVRPIEDKAQALDAFRYHIAVENHLAPHHITEKLTDAFLARCLTFYAGAPNATEYFPADSFIPVDIRDPRATVELIRVSIANQAWRRSLPAIEEARCLVLNTDNLFSLVVQLVTTSCSIKYALPLLRLNSAGPEPLIRPAPELTVLMGRHAWRQAHPFGALLLVAEKLLVRLGAFWAKGRFSGFRQN